MPHTTSLSRLSFVLQALLATIAVGGVALAGLGPAGRASATCDITSDSCDELASITQLRADIDEYVPARWQTSFDARLNHIGATVAGLESGDNVGGLFAVMLAYQKMMNAEARQDRENPRNGWRAEFLPVLSADIAAIEADICQIVTCLETEE